MSKKRIYVIVVVVGVLLAAVAITVVLHTANNSNYSSVEQTAYGISHDALALAGFDQNPAIATPPQASGTPIIAGAPQYSYLVAAVKGRAILLYSAQNPLQVTVEVGGDVGHEVCLTNSSSENVSGTVNRGACVGTSATPLN